MRKARIKGSRDWSKWCEHSAKLNKALRQSVLRLMGYKCVKCGYDSDWRALQIDHIHGCGKKNRVHGLVFYKKILDSGFEGKYQLLCANCNFIKRYENNELNHHSKKDSVK